MASADRAGDPADGADRSLAGERTQLAWNRSGLAVAVVVAILVRRLWPLGNGEGFAVLVVVAVGSLTWAVGLLMVRRTGQGRPATRVMGTAACRMLTLGTLTLATAGLLLTLLAPS
jgi:uncharacterized membrane protein YidH (DUF202 family)